MVSISRLPTDVIFDFDGTILNSSGNVLLELRSAIEKNGLVVPKTFDEIVIGPPMPQIIAGLFPEIDRNTINGILVDFRAAHDVSLLKNSTLYANVVKLFHALRNKGARLFIATNKPRAGLVNAINRFGLNNIFLDFSCFGDEGIRTKSDSVRLLIENYQIDPKSAWMVGDAKSDIHAGKENGLFTIAHINGYSSESELLSAEPNLCIKKYSELIGAI